MELALADPPSRRHLPVLQPFELEAPPIESFDDFEPLEPVSRDVLRSRRKREVRARTISIKRLTKRELEIGRLLYPETSYWKPRTRAECADVPRPCPYVSCKYHLYVEVSTQLGAIRLVFPDLEPTELEPSCALDVADRGGSTLEEVGAFINVTRERVRQIEVRALTRLEKHRRQFDGHLDEQRAAVRAHQRDHTVLWDGDNQEQAPWSPSSSRIPEP